MAKPRDQKPNVTQYNKLTRTIDDVLGGWRRKDDPSAKPWHYIDSNGKPQVSTETKQDKKWLGIIPCRRGRKFGRQKKFQFKAHIYVHSQEQLGYTGVGRKLRLALLALPDVKAWQTGDDEFSVVFPDAALGAVAEVVQPYAKRKSGQPSEGTVSEK